MEKKERALLRFHSGWNCAQSVLFSFQDVSGLDEKTALRIASPFGGGMGHSGGICGVVSGSLMVIGLVRGTHLPSDSPGKTALWDLTREFLQWFRNSRGTLLCRDLLGYDLSKPHEELAAEQNNVFHSVCRPMISESVEKLEELLEI